MNVLPQYQITLLQYGSRLETYLLSCRGLPELLQPQMVQSPMVVAWLRAIAYSRLGHILLCWGTGA
jgi:hypothetical protein